MAAEPTAPENVVVAGEVVHVTLATVVPIATGNWAAVAVGPGTPSLQLLRCP